MCIENNLSKGELRNKIKSNEYERLGFIDKEKIKLNNKTIYISELIKNPIIFKSNLDKENITKKLLKQLILENIEDFLKELGNDLVLLEVNIK